MKSNGNARQEGPKYVRTRDSHWRSGGFFQSDREKFRGDFPGRYFSIASRVALNSLPGFQPGNFDAFATL